MVSEFLPDVPDPSVRSLVLHLLSPQTKKFNWLKFYICMCLFVHVVGIRTKSVSHRNFGKIENNVLQHLEIDLSTNFIMLFDK